MTIYLKMFLCNKYMSWMQCVTLAMIISTLSAYRTSPPNVVFILVDDMGWNDVSFHGSDQIHTPNIDALAYQSVILQQYYSEPICTPARTALLTGKYPMRLGMHGGPLYNGEDRGIPLSERLLPSYMRELGYATYLVGKWHAGRSRPEYLPTSRGFDHHYGMRGGFVDYYTYNNIERWPNGRIMYGLDLFDDSIPQDCEQRYIVDALTDRAVHIIESHNGSQPLFLTLTHNAPHAGNEGAAVQPPLYSPVKHAHIANSHRRLYAASPFGVVGNYGVNLPLRGNKFTPWDGGVRVPAFIWQSSVRPRVWQGLMHITDWLPTLTAAAGGKISTAIDGVNQWDSIVRNLPSKRKEVLITIEDGDINTWGAYRAGDYKVIVGNVTGADNGYYGAELLKNKRTPPEYYSVLRSCEVTRVFEKMGIYLDNDEVRSTRRAATVRQEDPVRDVTPCIPTPTRGCLFNIRLDPIESHDLWDSANNIATAMTRRLRSLWATQLPRGNRKLDDAADPAYYNYVWTPWIVESNRTLNSRVRSINNKRNEKFNLLLSQQ